MSETDPEISVGWPEVIIYFILANAAVLLLFPNMTILRPISMYVVGLLVPIAGIAAVFEITFRAGKTGGIVGVLIIGMILSTVNDPNTPAEETLNMAFFQSSTNMILVIAVSVIGYLWLKVTLWKR